MIEVRPTGACMGTELSGVDLSQPLTEATFGEIREALHRHHVIVMHG